VKNYIGNALNEILLNNEPFTALESYTLLGSPSLLRNISRLRKEGFVFDRTRVPLEVVYLRLDKVMGKHMPRPRYVDSKVALATQYQRNKSKETRSAKTVYKASKDAAGIQVRRSVR
jgi:hypothetical protein